MTESQFRGFVVLAVWVAGFLAYSNTFGNEFVWDDASSILVHKHVQDPSQFLQLFREDQHPFGRGQGNFYRPLVAASFMTDFTSSRLLGAPAPPAEGRSSQVSPFLFHVSNMGWHVGVALTLFALLAACGAPRFVQAAVVLLYLVHPLHTEAVAYISGRADSMAATYLFLGLWLSFLDTSPRARILSGAALCLCFAAGLLSKESAFIFPFLLLLVALCRPLPAEDDEKRVTLLRRLIPVACSFAILGVYAYLRAGVLNFADASRTPASPLGQRLIETGQAFASYLRLLFLPTGLHMDRTLAGVPAWTAIVGYALFALCLALAVMAFRRGHRRIALGIGLFLASWLPISGIFPLNAPLAEHWMYVPLAGFIWAAMEGLALTIRSTAMRNAATVAVFAAFIALLALTVNRNQDWRDNETLFRATLARNPNSARVHFNLAVTYEDLLRNLPAAQRHYKAVIDLNEKQGAGGTSLSDEALESHLSLGKIYLDQGNYRDAQRHFQRVLAMESNDATRLIISTAAMGMGECLLAAGDSQQALRLFNQAVRVRPELQPDIQRLLSQEMLGTAF